MLRTLVLPLFVCAVAVAACSSSKDRGSDSTTAASAQSTTTATSTSSAPPASAPAATPATLSLAQLQGTWKGRSMLTDKDSVVATWTLTAPSDTSKWAVTFATGPRAPLHVKSIAGDSVVFSMGPYRSITRKQQVTADVVSRLTGDSLSGTYTMHSTADSTKSVGQGRTVATRAKP